MREYFEVIDKGNTTDLIIVGMAFLIILLVGYIHLITQENKDLNSEKY